VAGDEFHRTVEDGPFPGRQETEDAVEMGVVEPGGEKVYDSAVQRKIEEALIASAGGVSAGNGASVEVARVREDPP